MNITEHRKRRKVAKRPKNNLKTEQPHLWERIMAITIGFIGLGFPLLFAPITETPNANASILQYLLPLKYHGVVFLLIGLLLLVGTYRPKENYRRMRSGLSIALAYTLMWQLSLIWGAFHGKIQSFAIVFLWGVFTFLIYNTLRDPGFVISNLIREVRKHHDVS